MEVEMSFLGSLFGSGEKYSPVQLASDSTVTLVLDAGNPRGFLVELTIEKSKAMKIFRDVDFMSEFSVFIDQRISSGKYTDPRVGILPRDMLFINEQLRSSIDRAVVSKDMRPLFNWNSKD
jgi:hypothetical protein